jgi:hypothetical protein
LDSSENVDDDDNQSSITTLSENPFESVIEVSDNLKEINEVDNKGLENDNNDQSVHRVLSDNGFFTLKKGGIDMKDLEEKKKIEAEKREKLKLEKEERARIEMEEKEREREEKLNAVEEKVSLVKSTIPNSFFCLIFFFFFFFIIIMFYRSSVHWIWAYYYYSWSLLCDCISWFFFFFSLNFNLVNIL